jgi:hypothetical protein
MADVTLYFAPFPGPNAIGLQVEESPDGIGSWAQILDTDVIGEYPNWVTTYVVQATSIDYWFRLRWQLEGTNVFTEWSEPVKGSDLPFHWTVPDLYRQMTQHNVSGWTSPQLQMLIDRAYFLINGECGPYDESLVINGVAFGDIAQLVIHSVMDRMLPALSAQGLGLLSGMESETMGSYSYRRRVEEAVNLVAGAFAIPGDLLALICPYGAGASSMVDVSTTWVFLESPYTLQGTDGKTRIFTSSERTMLSPSNPYPWWSEKLYVGTGGEMSGV